MRPQSRKPPPALNLDHAACRVYVSSVGASQAPGVSKTVPRPSPARGTRARADRSTVLTAEPFSMSRPTARLGRIAILWRGDEAVRRSVTPDTSRFKAVFAALADVGVDAEPVVYEDDVLDAVRARLATLDGVLVWVNPIHDGR